jgi:hypothetical protein
MPAIHAFIEATKGVDARDKRGHDGGGVIQSDRDAHELVWPEPGLAFAAERRPAQIKSH